jgi:hypothetical protein
MYITTTGKIEQNYTIKIIVTTDFFCPNGCNNNGVCEVYLIII